MRLEHRAFTLPGLPDSGASVLLVHGLGGGPFEVQLLGGALRDRLGFTARGITLPGHEVPATLMPDAGPQEWLPAIERALDEMQGAADPRARPPGSGPAASGDRTVHLVGFSAGCLPVLHIAETRRLTGKVVLLAPFIHVFQPAWLPWPTDALLGAARALQFPSRRVPLRDPAMRREVRRCKPFSFFSLRAAWKAHVFSRDVMRHLDRVTAPTLILQGARDTVVDPRGAREVESGLTAPRRCVFFERSDHLLALDEERAGVFDEVCAFLAG